MSAVNFTLKPEKTTKLYLDNSFALKKRFNYVYVDLESALKTAAKMGLHCTIPKTVNP